MTTLRLYAAAGALALLLLAVTGAYFKGLGDANANCEARIALLVAQSQRQKDAEAEKARAASATLEAKSAKARVVYRDIVREVEKIVDRPIYRDGVCLDDDGVRLVNRAIAGPDAAPAEPSPAVPAN